MTLDWLQTLGWEPTPEILQRFELFFETLVEVNRSHNLTRITMREEFWEKHLWDSLIGIQPWLIAHTDLAWMQGLRSIEIAAVIDIGTGGGFPGIPVAIASPDWQVTLLDSTQKKVQSLKVFAEALGCKRVTPICDRAEILGQHPEFRATFDLAMIRAVAAPSVCAEYALPFLKEGGVAVLYRGHWLPEEEAALRVALNELGGEIFQVYAFQTPQTKSDRHCVYLKKINTHSREISSQSGGSDSKALRVIEVDLGAVLGQLRQKFQ
ncbi:MAG: 16S rRNA (guanine(527)-N(7))-methyltransferase RsmG [Acaryochloridaceae cyanobacterium RL_2_7]|nr:16S rRNA (guanine(527)-N(7))-methyltransferase RsmG [Acaryochloridaceae cyanobacterium RL_2_7]